MQRSLVWGATLCWLIGLSINSACKTMGKESQPAASRVDLLAMEIFQLTQMSSSSDKATKIELDVTSNEVLMSDFIDLQWSELQVVQLSDQELDHAMKYLALISEQSYALCEDCKNDREQVFLTVFQGDAKINYLANQGNCGCDGDHAQLKKNIDYENTKGLYQYLYSLFPR